MSNVHIFNKHECDDAECTGKTDIQTLIGCGEGIGVNMIMVEETEQQIMDKMKKVVGNFIRLSMIQSKKVRDDSEDWKRRDDDDDDQDPMLWA